MSDDVNGVYLPVTNISIAPYIRITRQAIEKILAHYGPGIKTNAKTIEYVVDESSFLQDEYDEIAMLYDDKKVEAFKGVIRRGLSCGIVATHMTTPGNMKKRHHTCHGKGCPVCAPYKANERVLYHDIMTRCAIVNDYKVARDMTNYMKEYFAYRGWEWLTINMTPFHDGTNMIRVGNLRYSEMNPLIDDNKVKESIASFDDVFNQFQIAERVSDDGDMVSSYLIDNVSITSTDIYTGREEGQKAKREIGTRRGFEYDAELDQVIYMSEKERKEKKKQEDGIVTTLNVPAAYVEGVSEEDLELALKSAVVKNSFNTNKAVFAAEDEKEMKHTTVNIMNDFKDELTTLGYSQPEMYAPVNITQNQIDTFLETYSVKGIQLPTDIMDVMFTDEMLSFKGVYNLRQQYAVVKNIAMHKEQQKIINAPSIDDFVAKMMKDLKKKPS